MGKNQKWKPEELTYLEEMWGHVSLPSMAKYLNRSVNAVKIKGQRLGLGPVLMGGEYITFNQLMITLTGHNVHSYHLKSWVKERGLPIHYKKVNQCRFRIVYLDEFWEWAEKNRSFIDFSRMEPLALGEEPEWVDEQRRKDYHSFYSQREDPWTPAEDNLLISLLKQHKYGYTELSERLKRSCGAIQRRCTDLGIKERPVKASNHGEGATWTEEHYKILAEGIRNGDSYVLMGRKIGKSEKAIRGKVYTVYLTENLDKVRSMLQNGEWGHGAPEPAIKQAIHLSGKSAAVKKDLSVFAGLLKYRMNKLGYDPYFQRFMCMNWDDFEGCSAGCTDCDSCLEFRRIKPQYCARCGGTFYERKENRFCQSCRTAKRKQAQRKWSILNRKGV